MKHFLISLIFVLGALGVNSQPNWNFNYTGSTNHTIILDAGLTVDSAAYIGVFFTDNNQNLICGGYCIYQGNTTAIVAWGDNVSSPEKDGFSNGEVFTFKYWRPDEGCEINISPTYHPIGYSNINHLGNFSSNGLSGIEEFQITTIETQQIELNAGWGAFSTHLDPIYPEFDSIFDPIINEVTIVKDALGYVYWPPLNFSNIGDLDPRLGYKIRMASDQNLTITGTYLVPEVTPIYLPAGWSMISNLRTTGGNISEVMEDLLPELIILKDEVGAVYWPFFGNINTIGDLTLGEGYMVKMISAKTFYYPPNARSISSFPWAKKEILKPIHYLANPTCENMTLGIPKNAWVVKPTIGTEIGIFSNGELVGSGVYQGKDMVIAVWGQEENTLEGITKAGESLEVRIWDEKSKRDLEVSFEGDPYYEEGKMTILSNLSFAGEADIMCYPNPFAEHTTIHVELADESYVELTLRNTLGAEVRKVFNQTLPAGEHEINFYGEGLAPGTYLLHNNISAEPIVLVIQ